MSSKRAITAAEAIAGPEARLVMDLPCETCGSEHWEKVDLEGRLYYRCAGTWPVSREDCRRLRPMPILKDPPPVATLLEGGAAEVAIAASPPRRVAGGTDDFETARAAMIRDAEATARRPEVKRARFVEESARGLKAISDSRWAASPGTRPSPMPLEWYEDYFRRQLPR